MLEDDPIVFAFEGWEVDLRQRELRTDGKAVPLGGRAFDILEVLVRAAGQLVSKGEILAQVWPGLVVEENTLQVHISTLRRAFGSERHLLKTSSGRGYRLFGGWVLQQPPAPAKADPTRPSAPRRIELPLPASPLIGRAEALERLADLAANHRLVTLTGPGGIGKTRLAVEAARNLSRAIPGDVCLVEMASLADPALLPTAVASVLGLEFGATFISDDVLVEAIGDRHALIVLDSCEHLIDAAARLAEAMITRCPHTSILATSVEPLRIDGETIFRVQPLDAEPSASQDLAATSAVQLFVARARALRADFTPAAGDLTTIAAICRHLDGLPLAIEFAAASAATLGVDAVLSRLDDRFGLLTGGRRTAQPRHRSLRRVLDWSYDLLSSDEQRLLRVVSVFPAGFTHAAALAVAAIPASGAALLDNDIGSLVDKSMLALDDSALPVRWRMLDTTRAYAREKLGDSGEADAAMRRMTDFFCSSLPQVALAARAQAGRTRIRADAREIDNLRAALDWAFSPEGDPGLGVRLTVAVVPVLLHLSLLAECNAAVERALDRLQPEWAITDRLRMELLIALAVAILSSLGPVRRADEMIASGLAIAETLDDVDHQLRAHYALWGYRTSLGEQHDALRAAERFVAMAGRTADPVHRMMGERITGSALHYGGDQRQSRVRLGSLLKTVSTGEDERLAIWRVFDNRVMARSLHARVLCLQGELDQARAEAAACVAEAAETGWGLEVRYPLAWAVCPIAILLGDLDVAERALARLAELRNGSNLAFWTAAMGCLEGSFLVRRGEHARAVAQLRPAIERCRATGWMLCHGHFLGAFAEALAGLGRWEEALAALDEGLNWSEATGERWYLAELHRTKGDTVLLEGATAGSMRAEACFVQAGEIARQQGALLWELRAAMSLARLRLRQDRADEARSLLAPVHARFTEGFDSADLRAAGSLLESTA